MRFRALAADYDGTLASDGHVLPATVDALDRLRRSGWRLLVVTGRRLDDLAGVFPAVGRFDLVVAENGAVLWRPGSDAVRTLGPSPPAPFVTALRRRGVEPLSVGRVIVATWEPHEGAVLETIRDLGLDLEVAFNKGAVMVLPAGVDKASGLVAALAELGIAPGETVGVGDAENDHTFLGLCGCAAAVANAVPAVKERAGWVAAKPRGEGVQELIERLLALT